MIRPTARALWLWVGGVGVAILPLLLSVGWHSVWLAYLLVLLLLTVADVFTLLPGRRLRVTHDAPDTIPIGESASLIVRLEVERWWPPRVFEVVVDLDEELAPQPGKPVAPVDGCAEVEFTLEPRRRGELELRRLWVRWRGPLGMVSRTRRVHLDTTVKIIPNVRGVREAALRFFVLK